jgi:hypothetical protein
MRRRIIREERCSAGRNKFMLLLYYYYTIICKKSLTNYVKNVMNNLYSMLLDSK